MLTKRDLMIPFITLIALAVLLMPACANLSTGTKAPNFSAATLGGKTFSVNSALKAPNKVLVLEFISVFCPHCQAAAPHMVALHKKYGSKGVEVASVVLNPDRDQANDFAKQYKINYPMVLDPDGKKTADIYKLEGVPSIYIIDSKGVIRYAHFGYPMDNQGIKKTASQIEGEVQTLLK